MNEESEYESKIEQLRGIIRMHEKTVIEQADHLAYMYRQLSQACELLHQIEGCPWVVEQATIPKAGIEAAPQQVVGTMHVNLMRLRNIRSFLSTSSEVIPENKGIKAHDGRCKAAEQKLLVQYILDNDKGLSDTSRMILEKLIEE